jgi:DNA-binding transcriptional ArsR family regulator
MVDANKCKRHFSALIQNMTTSSKASLRAKPKTVSATKPITRKAVSAKPTRAQSTTTPDAESGDIFALIGKSENIEQAAVAMQAMAHPMRIKILCMLSSGELPVQEIVDAVGTTQSNVSQHLGILKASGMISAQRDATRVLYRIKDKRILRMITLTRDLFCGI